MKVPFLSWVFLNTNVYCSAISLYVCTENKNTPHCTGLFLETIKEPSVNNWLLFCHLHGWSPLMIQLTDSLGRLQSLGSAGWDQQCSGMQRVSAELSPLWESSCAGTPTNHPPSGSCVPNLSGPTVPLISKNGLMRPRCSNFFGLTLNLQILLLLNIAFPRAPALGLQSSTQRHSTRKQAGAQTS